MGYTEKSLTRYAAAGYSTGVDKVRSHYLYVTDDALATVLAAGYFNAARGRLLKGDVIEIIAAVSTTPVRRTLILATVPASPGNITVTETGASADANAAKHVVVMPLQLADIATGTFKIALPFDFTVLSALFRTAKPATTAAKAATLTVGVNGAAVTGGVIALTSANQNAIGNATAATAITAANTGTAGQTVEVTASAVTAFVEGDGWVEFTVRNDSAVAALD